VVDSPERAGNVLKANGFKVDTSEVIAVGTPEHPEGLNTVLRASKEGKVNVETLISFCYPER